MLLSMFSKVRKLHYCYYYYEDKIIDLFISYGIYNCTNERLLEELWGKN